MTPTLALTPAVETLGLRLRFETDADVPFLRRLYISTRWEELNALPWADAAKAAFLDQQFDFQRAHYLRAYLGGEFSIVEREGEAVGRLYVFRGRSEIRIVDIAILPDWRRNGFGTALIEALFSEADSKGAAVSVHVEVFNPARHLYARLGFRTIGENGPYYLMARPPGGTAVEGQANTA